MTKMFVHGNPETAAIWGPLFDALAARGVTDMVAVSPPGFGAPVPDGWTATAAEYKEWLTDRIVEVGSPVDIVAHDWGAGHLFGVLADAPELVRSWATDCVGLLHPDYLWHDAAIAWQTPGIGESAVEAMVSMDDGDFVAAFAALGMTAPIAGAVKAAIDDDMARCILALYRSAAQPVMSDLGARVVAAAPKHALVVIADNDHFAGSVAMMEEMAELLAARTVSLAGAGHWWMIEQPDAAAEALVRHWVGSDHKPG